MDSSLPRGRQDDLVLYPDGTYGETPSDGTIFIDIDNLGASYQWDGLLGQWVDQRGELVDIFPKKETKAEPVSQTSKNCGCGAKALGVDKHAYYCDLYDGK